jgi:diguanylate cyclase (GGDEF)-like protein
MVLRYSAPMSIDTSTVAQPDQVQALAERNQRLMLRVMQLEREAKLAHHLAYHDPLTGLPNRALLLDRLGQAMLQATRQRKTVALLMIDLDRFKYVNDRFGHNAGDLLLQQVAARLLNCLRGCDTACRYGGDEFVIMLPEIAGNEVAEAVGKKIRKHLSPPYRLGNHRVAVGLSMGVALFTTGSMSCSEFIGLADAAMYRAKAAGRGGTSCPRPVPEMAMRDPSSDTRASRLAKKLMELWEKPTA